MNNYKKNGSLCNKLTGIVRDAFRVCGFDPAFGEVTPSNRPDLSQYQCTGTFLAAKKYGTSPREVAQKVVTELDKNNVFSAVSVAGPGFINLTVNDAFLVETAIALYEDERLGCQALAPMTVIVDFGGPNIAKPLHVGHLRSAIIGESIKRIARFVGHKVLGDIHLGDWGLQMGMLIYELSQRRPDLPYFDEKYDAEYSAESPVTVDDLEELYPAASGKAKTDEAFMHASRQATAELQCGRRGYLALWKHFVNVSIADLKSDYAKLNVEFDLWLGESDAQKDVPPLIDYLVSSGFTRESQGALIVDVEEEGDEQPVPPLIVQKADGAVLYSTTDLAAIVQRVRDHSPQIILYVVDNRQSLHLLQVFRCAHKTGIAPISVQMEHIGFGTMNGGDGRPFKTRAGGTMKLKDLIRMVTDKATDRINEAKIGADYGLEEKREIARMVGVATLKFADLSNSRLKDYIFDLDRFSSFEGRTGPYLLYTAVRAKSILRRARKLGLEPGALLPPHSKQERDLVLKLVELPDIVSRAFDNRAPNELCEYAYQLASLFSQFYHDHHILKQEDIQRRESYLEFCRIFLLAQVTILDLLGIEVPERM